VCKQVGTGEKLENREHTGRLDIKWAKNRNKFCSQVLSLVGSQRHMFVLHHNTAVLT